MMGARVPEGLLLYSQSPIALNHPGPCKGSALSSLSRWCFTSYPGRAVSQLHSKGPEVVGSSLFLSLVALIRLEKDEPVTSGVTGYG